jgi:hypothetical protein
MRGAAAAAAPVWHAVLQGLKLLKDCNPWWYLRRLLRAALHEH